MNYTVTWVSSCKARCCESSSVGPTAERLSSALDRIGSILAREGPAAGESRDQYLRILFALPLAVIFSVEESDRTITVRRVWAIAR